MREILDICRVEIDCTESDEYTIDMSFAFVSKSGSQYLVDGLCASPDIFGIKAHTLAKILAGSITLPRVIGFGFTQTDQRHVHFTFDHGPEREVILACTAFDPSPIGQDKEAICFEVGDDESLSLLLAGFRQLDKAPGGKFAWTICHDDQP